MHMRKVGTGNSELYRLSTRRKEEGVVSVPASIRELHAARCRVDRGDACVQHQFDAVLLVELLRSQGVGGVCCRAREKTLRQVGAVTGDRLIGAQHREATRIASAPKSLGGGI